jgi:hypothetical protein
LTVCCVVRRSGTMTVAVMYRVAERTLGRGGDHR